MNKVIYVADDEQDILDVLQEFLTNAGYDIKTFLTGDDLFSEFREKPCDLVILDIMMPGTDGLSVCKMIREISDVPVVILTAKESGIFVPSINSCGNIHMGDAIGDIIEPIEGRIIQHIESQVDGIVLTLRENPVVYKGALLARVHGGRV